MYIVILEEELKTMSEYISMTLCYLFRKLITYAPNRNNKAPPSPCAAAEVS